MDPEHGNKRHVVGSSWMKNANGEEIEAMRGVLRDAQRHLDGAGTPDEVRLLHSFIRRVESGKFAIAQGMTFAQAIDKFRRS